LLEGLKYKVSGFLNNLNIDFDKVLEGKNIVFIRVPDVEFYSFGSNPVIVENGTSIRVTSHTSNNAVYVFLPSKDFDTLKNSNRETIAILKNGKKLVYSPENDNRLFYSELLSGMEVDDQIIHEIGVICNLSFKIKGLKIALMFWLNSVLVEFAIHSFILFSGSE